MKRKCLVVGIILLFIGTTIIPSNGQNIEKISWPTSSGITLYVGGSGPGNYTRIQDAINDSHDGDTVFVYDDSSPYYENIMINKSINLFGENWNTDIIDGDGYGDVVTLSVDKIFLRGFRIQNSGDNNNAGIKLHSNSNSINGIILTNNNVGVLLNTSHSNSVSNNIIQQCCDGIILISSDNNIFGGNTIINNAVAFDMQSSNYNNISYSIIKENHFGLSLENSNHNIIGRNVIQKNRDGVNSSSAIYLKGDDNNITLNTVNNNIIGVTIRSGHDNNINKNFIGYNSNNGIAIFSSNNTIYRNTISFNNERGIFCFSNTTVNDNIIEYSRCEGLLLQGDDCIVEDNDFINNSHNWSSGGNLVVLSGEHNTIFKNTIRDSNTYGILVQTSNNTIYHNDFLDNAINAHEVVNYLYNNWDDGYPLGGNHWSDYTGNDSNHDGIGDTSYNISSGNSKDRYPLIHTHDLYYALHIILSSHEVREGSIFNVTVKSVANSIIPDVIVTFNNETKITDSNGAVRFTAPEVIINTTFTIIASKPGYINSSTYIIVKNTVSEFKKIIMFGRYTNKSIDDGFITIEAVNIQIFLFRSFQFLHYYSNEKLTFSNDYKGIITRRFIIGWFSAVNISLSKLYKKELKPMIG